MEHKTFLVNLGSSSKKFALFQKGSELCVIHLETVPEGFRATVRTGRESEEFAITKADYEASSRFAFSLLQQKGLLRSVGEIAAIGIRIVAPGKDFTKNQLVSAEYRKQLEAVRDQAPLHIKSVLSELSILDEFFEGIPIFGISDSAFHKDLPEEARTYALPQKVGEEFGLRRYGYHGIALQSVAGQLGRVLGKKPSKVIVCHLGGGASVTALLNGQSVETSMGFSPLAGVPMLTRVGDIDPGVVTTLGQKLNLSWSELRFYLSQAAGLYGLSGKSSDVRELLALEEAGDRGATLALNVFVHDIKKYIGAYSALLGGLDVLVFSGTIGERSVPIRARVCEGLGVLGILLDEQKNRRDAVNNFIEAAHSKVKIVVIAADELAVMAEAVENFLPSNP